MTLVSVRPKVRVSFAVPPITFVISAAQCRFLAARRVLRSATRGELLVPRARLAIMQRRAFSVHSFILNIYIAPLQENYSEALHLVVGPSAWNDLPVELRSLLMTSPSKFYISLKSFFFGRDWAGSASE